MADDKVIGKVFPDEYKQPFIGLLYVGAMKKTVEYAGHKIVLRTLTQGEELRVGQLTREYVGCRNETSALKLYYVAAAVESVDGKSMLNELHDDVDPITTKAEQMKEWYAPVVEYLYDEYSVMFKSCAEVAGALKK